ncbi:MAG: hypothetical protein LBD45_09765, partial [Bacteroidales bacterium]|nr:hypothetical protein [Bacteroidales bacterium]
MIFTKHKPAGYKTATSLVLCIAIACILAGQNPPTPPAPGPNIVHLEYADSMLPNEYERPHVQLFVGNVRFKHENATMDCDSSYFYMLGNSLDAYGNVEMNQADTLFAYGDRLLYDGNRKLARLRENVRMENRGVTLLTDSLDYDRVKNIGYFEYGGTIIDKEDNELSSVRGQYSPATKVAVFNYDVTLTNPRFVLYSDTLHYNTNTGIATILGPSRIVTDSC